MLKNLLKGSGDQGSETDVVSVVANLAAGTITMIDVREPDEWRDGHITGALHIPLGELARRSAEIDTTLPVVTVCRSGRRSLDAVRILQAAGVANTKSMAGGMIAWQEARQPIAR